MSQPRTADSTDSLATAGITPADIATTYHVLETLRDSEFTDEGEVRTLTEAHALIQMGAEANTLQPTESDLDRACSDHPDYTVLDVECPLCGCQELEDPHDNVSKGFGTHFVRATCAQCNSRLQIEYRATDISFTSAVEDQHSAVSQNLIEPRTKAYMEAEQFGPFPYGNRLAALDWPIECSCGEALTADTLVTNPDVLKENGIDTDDPGVALFECFCDNAVSVPIPETE